MKPVLSLAYAVVLLLMLLTFALADGANDVNSNLRGMTDDLQQQQKQQERKLKEAKDRLRIRSATTTATTTSPSEASP